MSSTFLSLGEAAKATGLNKATIWRAIESGRLSGNKVDGKYQIDPAELFRVYDPVAVTDNEPVEVNFAQSDVTSKTQHSEAVKLAIELGSLRSEVSTLRGTIDDLRRDKEDLRHRLDVEGEERRKLTLMLTHSMANETAPMSADKRSGSTLLNVLVVLLVIVAVGAVAALRMGVF